MEPGSVWLKLGTGQSRAQSREIDIAEFGFYPGKKLSFFEADMGSKRIAQTLEQIGRHLTPRDASD